MFNGSKYGDAYFDLGQKLKLNTARFAAYKAYLATKQLKAVKGKDTKIAKAIIKRFNQYQGTEYNSVVSRARTAKQFIQFKSESDVYPNLEWLATRSAQARELHIKFTGTILPINHPFWETNQPGNLWGCKCNWKTTRDQVTPNPGNDLVKPASGLEKNPANSREIFTDNHPYLDKIAGNKTVEKFVKDYVFDEFELIESFDKGRALVHPLVDKRKNDYADLKGIALKFAEKDMKVYILPNINKKSQFYDYLFNNTNNTKCPDLKINGIDYEYKGFISKTDRKITNMLTKGSEQSPYIIIDERIGFSDKYIINKIDSLIKTGIDIKEVWLWNGKTIRQLF